MKKYILSKLTGLLCFTIILMGCEVEANLNSEYTGREISVNMVGKNNFTVRGTMIMREIRGGGVEFDLKVKNTVEENTYPLKIYEGEYLVGELKEALVLEPVDGTSGLSLSKITEFPDGKALQFDTLLIINAHIRMLVDNRTVNPITVSGANIGSNDGRLE